MDAKVTLSFDAEVIEKAKQYAERHNISLSRLTEYVLRNITRSNYNNLEDFPISDWVHTLAEGNVEYVSKKRSSHDTRDEYFESKKK